MKLRAIWLLWGGRVRGGRIGGGRFFFLDLPEIRVALAAEGDNLWIDLRQRQSGDVGLWGALQDRENAVG